MLVDLPGVQRPRDVLTSRMARRVQQELDGADATLLMLNAEQGVGPGDRFIARTLAAAGQTGDDRGQQGRPALRGPRCWRCSQQAAELEPRAEVFPISARRGSGIGELVEHLAALMPEGPFMFAPGTRAATSPASCCSRS